MPQVLVPLPCPLCRAATLGCSVAHFVAHLQVDEKVLRRAFRHASKALHPDVVRTPPPVQGGGGGEGEGAPTIYDLNRAYEMLRLML